MYLRTCGLHWAIEQLMLCRADLKPDQLSRRLKNSHQQLLEVRKAMPFRVTLGRTKAMWSVLLGILLCPLAAASAQLKGVPTWQAAREWSISASSESLDHPINPVVNRKGVLFVADNGSGVVSTYDSTGRRLLRRGGRGAGPGELLRFALSRGVVGDSAWFWNGTQLRVVVWPPNGPARTANLPTFVRLSAASKDQVLRGLIPRALLPDGRMIAEGSDPAPDGSDTPSHVAVIGRDGVVTKILGTLDDSRQSISMRTSRGYSSFSLPFAFQRVVRASMDGAFVLFVTGRNGRNAADTVWVTAVRPNGDTAYATRVILPTDRVPKADLEENRQAKMARARERGVEIQLRDSLEARMPRTFPVVTDAIITFEGRAWLRLHASSGIVKYLSISRAGKPEGVVSLPQSTTIVDGWGESLWAIQTDQDGFRNIVRFRLRR